MIMPGTNKNLAAAKQNKKDEFYTQRVDIENELKHYKKHFDGKVVYCNCDDPYESWFFKYFAMNFNALGLKKLIATSYDGSSVAGTEINFDGDESKAHKIIIDKPIEDFNGDGAVDDQDIRIYLQNNPPEVLVSNDDYKPGDFRSRQCIEFLKEADIVVTNPPFSLFREYVAQLVEYGKKFLIIGHQGAIGYKEIFPLIKNNRMWLGFGFKGGAAHFYSNYEDTATAGEHREGMIRVSGVVWFTNLDFSKRHEFLDVFKAYSPISYPRYDNYDAIEVSKTSDIPFDYEGVMGVPITFLDKYNPEQFDILGITRPWYDTPLHNKYYPKQIQHNTDGSTQEVTKLNDGAVVELEVLPGDKVYYEVDGKYYTQLYSRILIRNKHPQKAVI